MRRKTSFSTDKTVQSGITEALKRLVAILARQAAREAAISTSAPIRESADECSRDHYRAGE
jgi:hypothetical protein